MPPRKAANLVGLNAKKGRNLLCGLTRAAHGVNRQRSDARQVDRFRLAAFGRVELQAASSVDPNPGCSADLPVAVAGELEIQHQIQGVRLRHGVGHLPSLVRLGSRNSQAFSTENTLLIGSNKDSLWISALC